MKALVVRTFRDKLTKVKHRKGKFIEVTKERFEQINSTALGVFVRTAGTEAAGPGNQAEAKTGDQAEEGR